MNVDRFESRLSEYLDGDLAASERAEVETHLVACAACRLALEELRAVVAKTRPIRDRGPARDLWPDIERAIASRGKGRTTLFQNRFLAAAASIVIAGIGFTGGRLMPEPETPLPPARFMLLLREPPGHLASASPSERAAIVDRYRAWARSLLPSRTMLDGAKLVDGSGVSLRPGGGAEPPDRQANGDEIGGFFVIGARDEEEALATARTCPHLEQGGWIEVRRFEAR